MHVIDTMHNLDVLFKNHHVSEVYAVSNWKQTSPIKLYVMVPRVADASMLQIQCNLHVKDCVQIAAVGSQESPVLYNKEFIWYNGEWRDFE